MLLHSLQCRDLQRMELQRRLYRFYFVKFIKLTLISRIFEYFQVVNKALHSRDRKKENFSIFKTYNISFFYPHAFTINKNEYE